MTTVLEMSTIVLVVSTLTPGVNVADLLFGQTRRSVLGLLYGHADEQFYLRQIARRVGTSVGAVQREVRQLSDAGLISRSVRGNQVLYQANPKSPIFSELKSLIIKTVGVHDVIREALLPLQDRIRVAFIYGSTARQDEDRNSDVDLMVIGKANFGEIVSALQAGQKVLDREINPTVYPMSEFRHKVQRRNHFLARILEGKKLFVIGDERELAGMVAKRLAQISHRSSREEIRNLLGICRSRS